MAAAFPITSDRSLIEGACNELLDSVQANPRGDLSKLISKIAKEQIAKTDNSEVFLLSIEGLTESYVLKKISSTQKSLIADEFKWYEIASDAKIAPLYVHSIVLCRYSFPQYAGILISKKMPIDGYDFIQDWHTRKSDKLDILVEMVYRTALHVIQIKELTKLDYLDIKPDNILIDSDTEGEINELHLIDFSSMGSPDMGTDNYVDPTFHYIHPTEGRGAFIEKKNTWSLVSLLLSAITNTAVFSFERSLRLLQGTYSERMIESNKAKISSQLTKICQNLPPRLKEQSDRIHTFTAKYFTLFRKDRPSVEEFSIDLIESLASKSLVEKLTKLDLIKKQDKVEKSDSVDSTDSAEATSES